MGVAHEEGIHHIGQVIADGGVEVVGDLVFRAGVKAHNGLALLAGAVLGKGNHLPGKALPRPLGVDGQGVNDRHLAVLRRNGPAALGVFRELPVIKVHAAPDRTVLVCADVQRTRR